jgi:hypothetical protein
MITRFRFAFFVFRFRFAQIRHIVQVLVEQRGKKETSSRDHRMLRGETLARPRDACRPGGPGRMLGFVFGVLFALLVVREVASLAGAGEGNDARFVEIPLEEPASSDGSRALKERAPGALAWETGRVPSSPPPPAPPWVAAATEREENAEEAEAEAPASREPAKEADENETDHPAAKKKSHRAASASPLPAIGGGFHVASGHVVDAHGEVMGASTISANDTESAATNDTTNATVSSAPSNPLLAATNEDESENASNDSSIASLDASCHAEDSLDLDGPAVSWGMDFKVEDAAACCAACQASDKGCNSWVFCPLEECWSPDIWNHTKGECWLKVQEDPRKPAVNFRGDYPAAFREQHSTAPPRVAWQAGVLLREESRRL